MFTDFLPALSTVRVLPLVVECRALVSFRTTSDLPVLEGKRFPEWLLAANSVPFSSQFFGNNFFDANTEWEWPDISFRTSRVSTY